MKNPRRPNDSPIKVEQGTDRDTRTCKAYKSTADYTYSKTLDYQQKEALGLLEQVDDIPFTPDPKLLEAIQQDRRKRNIEY